MYHTILFRDAVTADLEISRTQPLERVDIRSGTQARVQLKPYVLETPDGLVEVADLYFDDGSVTRAVPFEHFSFAD
jgi:hypothetical protein